MAPQEPDDEDEIGRLADHIEGSASEVVTTPTVGRTRAAAVASMPKESAKNSVEVSVPHARPAWIPKNIAAQCINQDGTNCWTVLIALTGGAIDEDNNGAEVEVTHVMAMSSLCVDI